ARIAEEKDSSATLSEEHAQADSALKEAKRANARATRESVRLEKRAKEMRAEVEQRNEKVSKLQGDLNALRRRFQQFNDSVRRSDERSLATFDEAAASEYNARKEEATAQTIELRQQLTSLQREVNTITSRKNQVDEALATARGRRDGFAAEEEAVSQKVVKMQEKMAKLNAELAVARTRLEEVEAERRRLHLQDVEKNEKLAEVQQRLSDARADRQESERDQKRRETLEALRRIFPGVYGRLTDLCSPTQRKYNVAVATVLGRNIDAIVVDTERTGIDCIQYLRDQRAGTATFLPIDSIVVRPVNEKFRTFARGARLAVDVIQVDPKFERAVHYACGSTLICDTLDISKEVCWNRGQEVKAVTLEGTVLHKTGLMTGGTSVASSREAQRWEDRDVEALKKARDNLLADLTELGRARRRLVSEDQLRSELQALEAKAVADGDSVDTTERRHASVLRELEQARAEVDRLEPEAAALESELAQKSAELNGVQSQINGIEDRIFAAFCARMRVPNIRVFDEGRGAERQQNEQKKAEFETSIAKHENEIEFETNIQRRHQERVEKYTRAIEEDGRALESDRRELEAFSAETRRMEAEFAEGTAAQAEMQERLRQRAAAVDEAKKALHRATRALEASSKELLNLEAKVEALLAERIAIFRRCKLEEISLPLLGEESIDDVSLEDLDRAQMSQSGGDQEMEVDDDVYAQARASVEQIQVDFSGLKRDLRENSSDEMDVEFQETLKNLSAEIERISPNMKAVEKFGDMEEKMRATNSEFENSRRDAKTAMDAFTQIKQERYDRFHRAFTHIAEHIDKIYGQLTTSPTFPLGGRATLLLEDSEEPYLDGVKFHAMPPMKRFRDMEQLSGGEKTVAALALLFAVHSYRPAPFFVLDEVDAALDNANVGLVARYVRQRAAGADSQFVVISLKSAFYEMAEALVGIYKDQEAQSSRILTLSLKGLEE
ncbi:Structural maintenance of chromosomes protein 1, partial [Cladochytrium tenue]